MVFDLRIVSVFAGVGGLEMGLEAAIPGAHTVAQVELDPYCRRVLRRHWPEAIQYEDVRMVHRAVPVDGGGCVLTQPLPPCDLICGGFPCQDISVAGKGAGLEGSRSGLWWELWRLIRDVRPRFVVLENVSALIVRGLDVVLGALAGLGYDAEWSVLSAAEVGAPHLRRRIFIIAWLPDAAGPAHGAVADGDGRRRKGQRVAQPRGEQGPRGGEPDRRGSIRQQQHAPEMVYAVQPRSQGQRRECRLGEDSKEGQVSRASRGVPEPGVGGAAHGLSAWAYRGTDPEEWERGIARTVPPRSVPDRVARLRCLGNAVVPQCAYEVGLRVLDRMEVTT